MPNQETIIQDVQSCPSKGDCVIQNTYTETVSRDGSVDSTNAIGETPFTVALSGRFDTSVSASIKAKLLAALESGRPRIIVDMSVVTYVDSAALAVLIHAMKRARRRGGDLRLVRPQNDDAMRIFRLTKFDEVFEMSTDLEQALEW